MVGFAGREVEGSSLAWEGEGGRGETMTTTTTIVGTEGGGASTAAAGEDEGGGGGTGVAAIEDSDGGGGGRRLGPRSDEGSWDVGNHVVTIAIGLPSLQHIHIVPKYHCSFFPRFHCDLWNMSDTCLQSL